MGMRASVTFDRIADRYDDTRGGLARGRALAAELAPRVIGPRVLEVGVGTGAVALGLAEHGHPVVGVDLAPSMLARAHQRLGAVVARADAARLPMGDASVDSIVAVWVLHLVGDLATVLGEFARVLRSGGRLVAVRAGSPNYGDDIHEAMGGLDERLRQRQDTLVALTHLGRTIGLVPIDEDELPGERFEITPEQVARLIEQRTWSSLWDVPPDVWEREVVPVIERVRDLPEPRRPRVRQGRFHLFVARRA